MIQKWRDAGLASAGDRAQAGIGKTSEPAAAGATVAVVHEWLPARAGSEQVFEAIAQAFPTADLYAVSHNPDVTFDLGGRAISTTFLNRLMARRGGSASTLPLMPLAWRSLRTPPYDVVITSAHAFARAFRASRDALHLSYTHTPMRYVWTPELDGRARSIPTSVLRRFQDLDRRYADTVDAFAANSTAVRDRIRQFYQRDAVVLPPPVDTEFFVPGDTPCGQYLLSASRFVPYKRHDLAIEAAAALDMPIVVAGTGPDEARLRAIADRLHPRGVTFDIAPSRDVLRTHFQQAQALIFPALEDFGIVPVEAQACGTPVVGLASGGSRDTIIDGQTGAWADEQTVESFAAATERVLSSGPTAATCRRHAETFSLAAFTSRMHAWVEACQGQTGATHGLPELAGAA